MIKFLNAKINIGLNIVGRRADGYHDLETVFYPVGMFNGTPENPEPFCDILEGVWGDDARPEADYASRGIEYTFTGRRVDCPPEKNLVVRAGDAFVEAMTERGLRPLPYISLTLEKHLPDGAGLGGGSSDASGVLTLLNGMHGEDNRRPFTSEELEAMALRLGADCPVFITNRPAYAEGVGERLSPVALELAGWWCVVAKPPVYVSTKEAFAGIVAKRPAEALSDLIRLPLEQWRGRIVNDFEASLFPAHPELPALKGALYDVGAEYASMSGSGSAIYGLFRNRQSALGAVEAIQSAFGQTVCTPCLLT